MIYDSFKLDRFLSLCMCVCMYVHTVMHPYIMYAFSFRKLVGFKKNCRNYKKNDSLKVSQVIKKNMKLWEGVAKLQSLKAIQKDSSYVHYFNLDLPCFSLEIFHTGCMKYKIQKNLDCFGIISLVSYSMCAFLLLKHRCWWFSDMSLLSAVYISQWEAQTLYWSIKWDGEELSGMGY